VVSIGKFKLYYAWVALFAACMLNIASRAARHDLFVPDGGRRHGPALGGWRGGFLFDVSGDYTGSIAAGSSRPASVSRWRSPCRATRGRPQPARKA